MLLISFFQKIWQWLNHWDTYLFLQVNTRWTHPALDTILPWWRDANTWIPLYLFFIVLAFLNFKQKALPWILFVVINVVLTDQVSSTLIKHWIARPRPCNEAFLMGQMRLLLDGCSGGYSFTSSHAANHFGFALFVYLTIGRLLGKWRRLLLIWAATICYAQVYVGVHYPLDVLGGALVGCGISYATAYFFNKKIGLVTLEQDQSPGL